MVTSKAKSVPDYLAELPRERRAVVEAVREVVLRHLPAGYREAVNWGMLSYEIPLERHPKTYNGRPLCYVALAAQKDYYSLYLMAVYQNSAEEAALREAFEAAGKKLDMGKCCVRFRKLDDLPLGAIGRVIAATPPERLIALHEAGRTRTAKRP
ncbi:MAG: DUF1801 domain-containing protein [Acidobacteriota bacterium]